MEHDLSPLGDKAMTIHPLLMLAAIVVAFAVGAICWGHYDYDEDRADNEAERERLERWAASLVRADIARGHGHPVPDTHAYDWNAE